jgi:hypothetical protein
LRNIDGSTRRLDNLGDGFVEFTNDAGEIVAVLCRSSEACLDIIEPGSPGAMNYSRLYPGAKWVPRKVEIGKLS